MNDNRTIESAQYINGTDGTPVEIKTVIDGKTMYVPIDATDNRDRILIQEWEDAGNTIAEAD
tara:strand:- start:44 stop:229 length:186 start_codon:yes stop_codon:yes gene_type:complete